MVNDTALMAMSKGSKACTMGEAIKLAEEMPKSEATGLAQTPTQAPLLQHAKNRGMMELMLPVIDVQIDLSLFIMLFFFFN